MSEVSAPMEQISIGNEVKDGFKKTDKWVKANLSYISEVELFYKQRAIIEREYADKLQKLCSESFQKRSKASSVLSVGDEPTMTPGSLESASMVAWKEVLIQTENIAKERRSLANGFDSNVALAFTNMQTRYTNIRDRWKSFNDEMIQVRDKNFEDMTNKKKNYDSACEAMENQRSKALKSASEKAKEKLSKREFEMNIAKNSYLISISVCNRLKDKYYYQDTPELLDGLQSLNEAKVSKMNSIWLSASIMEKESNKKIDAFVDAIDDVVKQNLPRLDTAMFVKHNLTNWNEPADFNYIPSSIWHDDEQMIVEGSELDDLKIKLNEACAVYENFQNICDEEKQDVEELLVQRNQLVGDTFNEVKIKSPDDYTKFEELLLRSISSLQKFTNDDTKRVISEVEIETIQASTGDTDMTITQPIVREKKSKFGFLKFKHNENSQQEPEIYDLATSVNQISIMPTNTKIRMFNSLGKAVNNVVDAYNTPVGQTPRSLRIGSVSNSITNSTINTSASVASAVALYAYTITGDDELNMAAGEVFTIVESDDGSGWTSVRNSRGEEGVVPSSYLKVQEVQLSPVKKHGPKVVPRRGAKKVKHMEILYDYDPQGDDELEIHVGDQIVVLNEDEGTGWTEGELDGQVGLFPTSYGKMI